MEFQITNEISEFWFDLVPPIFLGVLSIICFLWVLGKKNRLRIMKYFVYTNDDQYVMQNGILIPKSQTIEYAFRKKILSYTGLDSIKPVALLFLIFLFFYGLNQILTMVFQPILSFRPDGLFFAANVEEHVLATIWMNYPSSSISDLYTIIVKLTETPSTRPVVFLDSVRNFIQFDLLCCLLSLFLLQIKHLKLLFTPKICRILKRSKLSSNRKMCLRLLLFTFILFLLLGITLLCDIYEQNDQIIQMCNQAYSILGQDAKSSADSLDVKAYQDFLSKVRQHKEWSSTQLFYGAYGISGRFSRSWSFIVYVYNELRRFFL